MLPTIALLLSAVGLALLSPATACRCHFQPLSECLVGEESAALLVTIKCVTTKICSTAFQSGDAVADVEINQVFKDNTKSGLKVGDIISVMSSLNTAACGIGGSFEVGDQWIMFPGKPFPGETDNSDDTLCDLESAEFQTNACVGNVLRPSKVDRRDLELGCAEDR